MTYKSHTTLLDYLVSAMNPNSTLPVLDLACGKGRSGLILARRGIEVVFADRSASALHDIEQHLSHDSLPGQAWQVDLEQADSKPLAGKVFRSIICFRYLYRPLIPEILGAVEPGGMVIYETFTTENRRYGRPNNPDFLLKPGELAEIFNDWQQIHYYEGLQQDPDRAIAQVIARKPIKANEHGLASG